MDGSTIWQGVQHSEVVLRLTEDRPVVIDVHEIQYHCSCARLSFFTSGLHCQNLRIQQRETHTECGCRIARLTQDLYKLRKLAIGLERSCSRLSAVNLLCLSPVCIMSETCFRHKHSYRSTMPHSVYIYVVRQQ